MNPITSNMSNWQSYTSGIPAQQVVTKPSVSVAATPVVATSPVEVKPKKSFTEKIKGAVESIWKTYISVKEYIKNTGKGIYYAVIAGAGTVGASWIFKSISNIKQGVKNTDGKLVQTVGNMIATPFKLVGSALKEVFKDKNILHIVGRILKSPYTAMKAAIKSNNIGKLGKIGAPLVALGVLGGFYINALLKINKGHANVDHSLKTGHNN